MSREGVDNENSSLLFCLGIREYRLAGFICVGLIFAQLENRRYLLRNYLKSRIKMYAHLLKHMVIEACGLFQAANMLILQYFKKTNCADNKGGTITFLTRENPWLLLYLQQLKLLQIVRSDA